MPTTSVYHYTQAKNVQMSKMFSKAGLEGRTPRRGAFIRHKVM